jgi:hypothetical protein
MTWCWIDEQASYPTGSPALDEMAHPIAGCNRCTGRASPWHPAGVGMPVAMDRRHAYDRDAP